MAQLVNNIIKEAAMLSASSIALDDDLRHVAQIVPVDRWLLKPKQVSEILGISESHLCNMRDMPDEGGLHVTYVGSRKTPRYSGRAIINFIDHGGHSVDGES